MYNCINKKVEGFHNDKQCKIGFTAQYKINMLQKYPK